MILLPGFCQFEEEVYRDDIDGNGVADFWTKDLRGLFGFAFKGKPVPQSEESVVNADASPGGSRPPVPYHGYLFVAMLRDGAGAPMGDASGRNPSVFGFCAYPTHRWAGNLTDIVGLSPDGRSSIWAKDTGGKPVTDWPGDPSSEGWVEK